LQLNADRDAQREPGGDLQDMGMPITMRAMQEHEAYTSELQKRGLSVTRLRLAIMEELHAMGQAATPADLLNRLQRDHSIHKTTVYRNLGALEEAGLLRKVPTGGREFVYELTCGHRPEVHPHFTCRACDRVVCLSPVDLSSVWELLTQNRGLEPERAEVTLVGLCEECAAGAQDDETSS
jgi:Fur family ferric uptake transcriptional regulator